MKLFKSKKKKEEKARPSFFKKSSKKGKIPNTEASSSLHHDNETEESAWGEISKSSKIEREETGFSATAHSNSNHSLDELEMVMNGLDDANPFLESNVESSVNELEQNDDASYDASDNDDFEEVRSSPAACALEKILDRLTEQEYKEWTDDAAADTANSSSSAFSSQQIQDLLRRTVDCMDIDPQDAQVQRTGTRILYKLTTWLEKEHRKQEVMVRAAASASSSAAAKPIDCWYEDDGDQQDEIDRPIGVASESSHSHRLLDDDEMELIIDSVDAVLQAMEDFPDDEVLVEDACLALESITILSTGFDTNTTKRMLEEILVAIEGFADNPIVVSSSLGVLGNLSKPGNDENDLRRKLARYALPSILHGMKEHRENVELYTKGCKAMSNFTFENPSAQHLLACKETLGLRIIGEGMHASSTNQRHNYGQKNEGNVEALVFQNLQLRSAALRVLKNLSLHPSLEVKGKIALGGGAARIMDRLLQVLQQTSKDLIANNYQVDCTINSDGHDDDEVGTSLSILQDALQILANLANIESVVTMDEPQSPHIPTMRGSNNTYANHNTAEGLQKQLVKAVKPVLNVIRHHPTRWSLQYYGLECIHKLTVGHANSIANLGGLSTLLNALSSQPSTEWSISSSTELHEKTLACLTGLLSPSSNADGLELVSSLETEEGLETTFRIVRQYQSQAKVITKAFEALFYLSCRVRVVLASLASTTSHQFSHGAQAARKLSRELCLEENIFVLLGTMNQYLGHPQDGAAICQKGLGALVNVQAFLQLQEEERKQQEELERKRMDPISLQQQSPKKPRAPHDVLASYGAIKRVLAVMRRHGLAVAIQEYGVALLAGILHNGKTTACQEFFEEEGISTILAAMMVHKDHMAIQSGGCEILYQLITVHHQNPFNLLENDSRAVAQANYYKRCIIQDTDAIQVVEAALKRFPIQKGMQHRGTILLKALTANNARISLPSAAAISTALQSSLLSSSSIRSSATPSMKTR